MQIIKALIGGIIGGGIGAFLSSQIQSMAGLSSPWFLLLIGLGTGIGARLATGANRSFATGVTGAVTAILVIFGSAYMDAMAGVQGSAENNAAPVSVVDISDIAPADDADEETSDEVDAENGDEADEPDADGAGDGEAGDDAESDDAVTDEADADYDPTSNTGPSPNSSAPAGTTASNAPVRSRFDWSPLDFLINGGSALLAFALSSGSGAAAGGGSSRGKDSDA